MEKVNQIAVFDSGVGGISVLRQLLRILPRERYLYYGDSANAPYGIRPREEVRDLTMAAVAKLMSDGMKALVVACNTATSAAMEDLKARYPETIIVGIEPPLAQAAERFQGGHVGVLATPTTLEGDLFRNAMGRYENKMRITPLPAPGLMDLVEAGKPDGPEAEALLHKLLDPYVGRLDALLLGCTHFPFVEGAIRRVLGADVELLDGAVLTAEETHRVLEKAGLLSEGPGEVIIENSLPGDRMLKLSRQLAGLE